MAIVKTDLVSQFGAHYINQGQNMDRLLSGIRQPSVTPSFAVPIITENDIYQFANVKFGEIVQQFQKAFTPKGDVTFLPNEIRLRNIKMDLSLYPDDVKGSYLGFLAGLPNDMERANWPIVRYVLEKEATPQLAHDMEMKAYWGGVYAAPTTGSAGTAAGSLTGLKKLIDDGLAETNVDKKMHAITLSDAPDASNSFEMIEEFADGIDEALAGTPVTIYMSRTRLKAYLRDKRNTHGNDINYQSEKLTVDFDDNKKLVALPSMSGSDYIWATPDFNFLHLRKFNGMSAPKIEEAERQVKFMLDWWEGIGFGANPLVYAYKPE